MIRIVTVTSAALALIMSIACLVQLHTFGQRLDTMATAITSMQHTLAAAACGDCRTRLASEVGR